MTAAFSTSRYDGYITLFYERVWVYYDYENVLSFDNVRDSVNQWNNWLMEGQANGYVDDRQMQSSIEQKCPVIRQ